VVIDTNIVLRYLLRDNDAGFEEASKIFESGREVKITDLVISEVLYVMRGVTYKKSRQQAAESIRIALQNNNVINPSGTAKKYLELYMTTNLDLVDCYLIASVLKSGEELKTFDKKMQKVYEQELANC